MPTCIYCRNPTTGAENDAHAIPEALRQNDCVLPAGAQCNACNSYLSKLDTALVLHQQVWIGIQVLALPGKAGRPRTELGWMRRDSQKEPQTVRIEGKGKNELFVDGNHVRIETSEAPGWNPSRFRRSLHYVGLNFVGLTESLEVALDDRYDPVRRYVRYPNKGEKWPYVEYRQSAKLSPRIEIARAPEAPGEVVALGLFHYVFFVDLLGGRKFVDWTAEIAPGSKTV